MACPTCSKTMHGVGYGIFHCPTCGTMKNPDGSFSAPALVGRCREFIRMIDDTTAGRWFKQQCHISGVTEAVLTPEERPAT